MIGRPSRPDVAGNVMPTDPVVEVIEWSVDEKFVDILCSDTELVRARFDAIIAAEWPDPPSPVTRRLPASFGPGPGRPGRWSADPLTCPVQRRPLDRDAWRRQRSPPA